MRHERYRFSPVHTAALQKRNGNLRDALRVCCGMARRVRSHVSPLVDSKRMHTWSDRDPSADRRYQFDRMDTIPYWYSPVARVFGVPVDVIAVRAERRRWAGTGVASQPRTPILRCGPMVPEPRGAPRRLTVRRRVWPISFTTRRRNVRNVGNVKHGNRLANKADTVRSGRRRITLVSRGWYRNRRCFPLHTPRSTSRASPACPPGTPGRQPARGTAKHEG